MEWWMYAISAIGVFCCCLFLNYIVKKINEAHLEERMVSLQLKRPVGQVTQVQETVLDMTIPMKLSKGKLTTRNPNLIEDVESRVSRIKENEVIEQSETQEESPCLGTIYKTSDVPEMNRTNIIELSDVAQPARSSEILESKVHDNRNEPGSKTNQIVIYDLSQNDRLAMTVKENKALTIKNSVIEDKSENCSKIKFPDNNSFTENNETEKTKTNLSSDNQRLMIDDSAEATVKIFEQHQEKKDDTE